MVDGKKLKIYLVAHAVTQEVTECYYVNKVAYTLDGELYGED